MTTGRRLMAALLILAAVSGTVLLLEFWRGQTLAQPEASGPTLVPGAVPIYLQDKWLAAFTPADLTQLHQVSFVEPAEGVTQEGWLLYDVLRLYLPEEALMADTRVRVSSSSRKKTAELTWSEIAAPANRVMFDLSGRGTLKLVSTMAKLATRDQWIQDTDRIEVFVP